MNDSSPSPERLIYLAACKLDDLQAQRDFLDEACGSEHRMRERLDHLLQIGRRNSNSDPLNRIVDDLGLTNETGVLDPIAPTAESSTDSPTMVHNQSAEQVALDISRHPVIDRYKLLEELGQGGMGTVYMAQQTAPVKRKVALKIVKPGMDSREVIARFQAERQALAMMDHPNIARVLDAGTTDHGRPYFVMELVRGIPITKFCDEKNLSLEDRLKLFIDVCKAVQHAHQKAIIHRDLKPSNILVTLHDGEPVAKVIDFGVAKALNQELTEQTLFTQFAQMIGTPLYMSPEQAEMSGLDMDTRSDIYSLGVVLYELLTGTTPIERESLATAGFDAIRRMVLEQEAERPSSRISTLKAGIDSTIAKGKQAKPPVHMGQLSSELDWIVLKALEKDRTRRYETANAFAADVQRFLDGDTVQACPPSLVYRLRKTYRRHRTALVTSTLVLLGILVGAGFAVWKAIEAEGERVTANEQRELANQSYEQSLAVVEQMLERVADSGLASTPQTLLVRSQLYDDAIAMYRKLEELRPNDIRVKEALARTFHAAGDVDFATQQFDRGLANYDSAIQIQQTFRDIDSSNSERTSDLAHSMSQKAGMLVQMGRPSDAAEICLQAVELMETNPNRHQWANCLQVLAKIRNRQERYEEAESLMQHALSELPSNQKPSTNRYESGIFPRFATLADAQFHLGKHKEAAKNFGNAITYLRRVVERNWDLAISLHLLRERLIQRARAHLALGENEAALRDLEEAWAISVAHSLNFPASREIWWFGECGKRLVQAYIELGKREHADTLASSFRPENAAQNYALGMIQRALGDDRWVKNLEICFEELPNAPLNVSRYIGDYYYERGNWEKVVEYQMPREGSNEVPNTYHWRTLGRAQFELRQYEEALNSMIQAIAAHPYAPCLDEIPAYSLARCQSQVFKDAYLELIENLVEETDNYPTTVALQQVARIFADPTTDADSVLVGLRNVEEKMQLLVNTASTDKIAGNRSHNAIQALLYGQRFCLAVSKPQIGAEFHAAALRLLESIAEDDELPRASIANARYQVALSALFARNVGIYQEYCRKWLKGYSFDGDLDELRWLLWTFALGPNPDIGLSALLSEAETKMDKSEANRSRLEPYYGALLYRANRLADAARVLAEIVQHPIEGSATTYYRFFYAMALHQLGEVEAAQEQFEQAENDAKEELKGNPPWNRRLTLELLSKEAKQTILGSA